MVRNEVLERRLLWLCLGLGAWTCLTAPIFSQEAYYWCYAQHPDLSYFDHPPMAAWMIWVGTRVFGDNVIGIRAGTLLCSVGATAVGVFWLRCAGVPAWVRRAWIVCSFAMPMLMVTHFLATPDPPLVFWWTLVMYATWRTADSPRPVAWWLLAGFAAGCALLSKYTAAFLAVGGVLVLLFDLRMRRQLRGPGPYLAVAVAAVTFLPVVLWNVGNDFESFRFQTDGRWQKAHLGTHWLVQFVASQIGLLNPVLALPLPFAALRAVRRAWTGDRLQLWLVAFGLPMPLFFLGNSLFIQSKVNWLLPCFLPLAVIVLTWWHGTARRERSPRATRIGARVLVGSALLFALGVPLVRLVPQATGSSWHGWGHIAARAEHWEEALDTEDGVEGNVFFFALGYRDASQLTLALEQLQQGLTSPHVMEPVMAQNVVGRRALQFDHWEPPQAHVGQDAILVMLRPDRRQRERDAVARHFDSLERCERIEFRRLGMTVAVAEIYRARGYHGPRGA